MVKIYCLVDPDTNQIRYVGKTIKSLSRRLNNHLHSNNRHHTGCWLKALKNKNMSPYIYEIEESTDEDWIEAETFWISYFKFIGANLTNIMAGGQGTHGLKMSEERKSKISNALKGRPAHNKGKEMPFEMVELARERMKKRMSDPVYKEKMRLVASATHKGRKSSEEKLEKMSKARKGVPWTENRRNAQKNNNVKYA